MVYHIIHTFHTMRVMWISMDINLKIEDRRAKIDAAQSRMFIFHFLSPIVVIQLFVTIYDKYGG